MAACGSLQHIFEKTLPENPTLLESLSQWNQLKPVKPLEQSSFIEIFGELHFKENPQQPSSSFSVPTSSFSSSSSSSSSIDSNPQTETTGLISNDNYGSQHENTKIPSIILKNQYTSHHKKSDSLQLCTEGLGFESSDDVEDLKTEMNREWQHQEKKVSVESHSTLENTSRESRKMRLSGGAFPPPISCIGKSGKPGVCFKSYRQDGRFVLKEVRIPTQELLHACREDGRLKLQFIQPHDEAEYEEGKEENFTEDDEQEQTEETANSCDDRDRDHHDDNTNNRAAEN